VEFIRQKLNIIRSN